jgi:hypothetical protein
VTRHVDQIEFQADHLEAVLAVLAVMADLANRRDGWVNLQPAVPEEDLPPPPSGFGALFPSPSFDVPLGTWMPGRDAEAPDSVGLQHAAQRKVAGPLAGLELTIPEGWVLRQDHPRRGLVIDLPPGTPPAAVLGWLIPAATALCLLPLTGDWRALVHRRS